MPRAHNRRRVIPGFAGDRFDLLPVLLRSRLSFAGIGRTIGCSSQNVAHFIHGRNHSEKVARAIADLTGLPYPAVIAGRIRRAL